MPVDYVQGITKGINTLNQASIGSLIEKSDEPMIAILSKACPESHIKTYLPEKLSKNIMLYKHIQKVKKKNENKSGK